MLLALLLLLIGGAALATWARGRHADERADRAEWQRLVDGQPSQPAGFDPDTLGDQPEPVQRMFRFLIAPGTPLLTVAQIGMGGEFSLGDARRHRYWPMRARQILACPHGFVWAAHLGGLPPIQGSDSGRWTRFRLLGLLPLAHLGGTPDHERSAFGRMVAEAVFWAPASVLPGPGIRWSAPDAHTARLTLNHGHLSQTVDVNLAEDGRPVTVVFQRWSNANPAQRFQWQPFGGALADWRPVQGFRLPFEVQATNCWGEADAFTFFRAQVEWVRFAPPDPSADTGPWPV